jgi:hypothetical protein
MKRVIIIVPLDKPINCSGMASKWEEKQVSLKTALLSFMSMQFQDINELLCRSNITIYHILRKGNQCIDFFAKLGASSDNDIFCQT